MIIHEKYMSQSKKKQRIEKKIEFELAQFESICRLLNSQTHSLKKAALFFFFLGLKRRGHLEQAETCWFSNHDVIYNFSLLNKKFYASHQK